MIGGQAATVGSCCSPGVDVLADQGSDGPICCGRCTATLPIVQQRTHGHGWWRPKAPVGPRAPPVGTVRPDGSDDVARGGSARGWAAAAVFCAAGGTASSARKERTTRAATSRSASARPGWELTLRFLRATFAEPTAQGLAIETDGRHRRRTFHRRDTPVTTARGASPTADGAGAGRCRRPSGRSTARSPRALGPGGGPCSGRPWPLRAAARGEVQVLDVQAEDLLRAGGGLVEHPPQRFLPQVDFTPGDEPVHGRLRAGRVSESGTASRFVQSGTAGPS